MSCPSWSQLLAEREASGVDPAGWDGALAHLDRCPRCARDVPALDPLLLFRRLPAPRVGPADVEAMKQGVAAMIRASRVQVAPTVAAARQRRRRWPRLPAAAAALLLLGFGAGALQVSRWVGASRSASTAATADPALAALVATPERAAAPESAALDGMIEDLSLGDARVYEVASEGLSVVTIVHPSLSWPSFN